jgi:predicted acetyltransferase
VFVDIERKLPEMRRIRRRRLTRNRTPAATSAFHRRAAPTRITGVDDETPVMVVEAGMAEKPLFARLMELYLHDFSRFTDADVDTSGRFGYEYLDAYWIEPGRRPFLFRVHGRWAGFALVRAGVPHDMAEFFVLRKYRRRGVGVAAACELFARFPGEWQVRQMRVNVDATAFWRRAIPVEFVEEEIADGPVQRFTMPG